MATNFYKVTDNYLTTIDMVGGIDNNDTSLTVDAAPVGITSNFIIVVWGSAFASPQEDVNRENILVSSVTGNTFTLAERGVGASSAHSHDDGSKVAIVMNSTIIEQIQEAINDIEIVVDNEWGGLTGDLADQKDLQYSLESLVDFKGSDYKIVGFRGINLSGIEFAGVFQVNTEDTYKYYASKGFNLIRLPFEWYELQPILFGDLDPVQKGFLDTELAWARKYGLKVILDMHNGGGRKVYRDGGFTDDFANASTFVFRYAYADHNPTLGELTVRDFGLATAGTLLNPLTPKTSYVFETSMKIIADTGGAFDEMHVQFYKTDDNNMYRLVINRNQPYTRLEKIEGGVLSVIATNAVLTWTLNTYYVLNIDVSQTTPDKINISRDGTPIFTVDSIDLDADFTSGYVAIKSSGANVTIKDVTLNIDGDTTLGGVGDYKVTDAELPLTAWEDFWTKLSDEYKDNVTVIGYDHNESHDMPVTTTTVNYDSDATNTIIVQSLVDTIRANGDTKYVVNSLDFYSGLQNFVPQYGANPDPWITDPLNKVIYSAHYYFDENHSGTYTTNVVPTLEEIDADCKPFLSWCRKNGLICFIGETGVPNTNIWQDVFEYFYQLCDTYNAWVTQWAGGELYTSITTSQPTSSYTVDRLQMATMVKHLGRLSPQLLDEMQDVVITDIQDEDVLTYDLATEKFINKVNKANVLKLQTPASASATGVVGQVRYDSTYIYVCVATNQWKRVAILTW